jgi:hypothetical protein
LGHDYYKPFLLATLVPFFSNMGFGFGFDFLIGGGGDPSFKIQNIKIFYTKNQEWNFYLKKR